MLAVMETTENLLIYRLVALSKLMSMSLVQVMVNSISMFVAFTVNDAILADHLTPFSNLTSTDKFVIVSTVLSTTPAQVVLLHNKQWMKPHF